MLQHIKNGVFSVAANHFKPSNLFFSSFSSNQNRHFTKNPFSPSTQKPRISSKKKTPKSSLLPPQIAPITTTDDPRYNPKATSSKIFYGSSDVLSICSLLCNSIKGSRNLEILLKEFKNELNSNLVLTVLMNYKHLGRINTLDFFSWAGMQMGFRFDDSVVEYMADYLGRRKLFDDLKCLLKTACRTRGEVSCKVVSVCIRFLGRHGRVEDALYLFEEMKAEFNCKPDNLVFNNMLYVLCKKENSGEFIDLALEIFHKMESPDTYSYSNILVGLCKFNRLESALDVFNEMGRAGLVPTRSAINILIGELCKASSNEGSINKVKITNFRRCRSFNILVPNVASKGVCVSIQPATQIFFAMLGCYGLLPSSFVVIQLISELCRVRKIDEAFDILKVVEEKKMTCVEESYTILIRALCDIQNMDGACKLFGRMLSKQLKPKLLVYNYIICLLCENGNVEEADRVFEIMNKRRCAPDNVTYTALIHGYVRVCKWEEAYGLLMEMLGMGWCPHYHSYSLVNRLLKEHGRADLLFKLECKFETQLLQKHCKAGRLEEAYEKLRSMHEKGFYIPINTRDIFESAFRKAGKRTIARELLERMDLGNSEGITVAEEVR